MATSAGAAAGRPKQGVVAELTLAKSGQSTPLTAISLSSDQRVGVVGGHGIMKVIRLAPEGLSEVATLKAGRRKGPGSAGSKLSMYDVAWCPTGGHVAASLSNGGVAIWDLQHLPSSTAGQGLQGADVRGEDTGRIIGTHERSVNRLSWNPFHHNMLLSGSQDGYLKIWDTRSSKAIAAFNSKYGAVRDVQFSPLQECHFAAVFDNGKLQLWDYQFLQPKMKIACHTKSALSVSWHHTLPWRLATSSHKLVKVWDLHPPPTADRHHQQRQQRQQQYQQQSGTMEQSLEATITLHSPGVVSRAKWRPGHPNQIASAQIPPNLGDKDFAIMVQDVTDPDVALFSLYGGGDKKNGFCWLDTPLLPPSSSEAAQSLGAGLPLSSFVMGSGGGASGLSISSSGRGWRPGAGGEEPESDWRGGMGTWQHMITCSDRGKVRVHSLAKSTLPRRRLEVFGTDGFKASSRGEMTSWLHRRNDDPNIWKIYQNKDTQASPGIFREEMLGDGPGIFPQQLQQKISRSLSVGDQTGGIKGRRMGAAVSSMSLGGSASGVSAAIHRTNSSGLPRSPGLARGQSMSGASVVVPHLGLGLTASASEDTPPPPPRSSRPSWTVYPVPDKPVALDVVNWRRIRRREYRWVHGIPQPRTNVQRAYGPELTEHLTKSVLLRGYHIRVLAAHNTEVYLRAGLESMAYTWRMLGIMLAGVPGGLLLPLGASEPDVDVAGIDAGIVEAVATAEAAANGGVGGWGRGGPAAAAARGRGRDSDAAAAGREGDFSVTEVLDLIDRHEEEEEEEEEEKQADFDRRLTPEQRQQRLHISILRQPSGRVSTRRAVTASASGGGGGGGGGGDDLKLPPRRPRTVSSSSKNAAAAAVSDRTTVLALTTPSESVSSSSRHGARSNSSAPFGGGSTGNGSGNGNGGVGGSSMWRTSQSRLLQPADTSATNMEDDGDDDGRDDSDLDTTNTTSFAANESVWWEPGDRVNRGGAGGNGGGGGGGGGGRPSWRYWRPERQGMLPDEVTLDWLWKSEIRDWLMDMSRAGFAYDTVAVLEVVRSWYYGSGPGRDEDVEEDEADPEEMCDINDAPGFWLGTDIPNLQVRMWYVQALRKLWQLQLYSAATDIIKHCADPYIAQMHRQSMTISLYCTGCGSSRPSGSTSTWCTKCAQHTPMCPLCDVPVVGRYIECPGCHHGGHADHIMSWFSISRECPVETCDHECVPCMAEDFKLTASQSTASELRQWQEYLSVR